jgi:hypothetical protein
LCTRLQQAEALCITCPAPLERRLEPIIWLLLLLLLLLLLKTWQLGKDLSREQRGQWLLVCLPLLLDARRR